MPNLAEAFPHIYKLTPDALMFRRAEIVNGCRGQFSQLSDEALSELLAINRALTQKNVGPPRKAAGVTAKTIVSLDDI